MIATMPAKKQRERVMPQPVVVTTIRVAPPLYERIQKLAQKEGIPINSWLVRAAERDADRLEKKA